MTDENRARRPPRASKEHDLACLSSNVANADAGIISPLSLDLSQFQSLNSTLIPGAHADSARHASTARPTLCH